MKKAFYIRLIIFGLILTCSLGQVNGTTISKPQPSSLNEFSLKSTEQSQAGRKRKDGRFKRKKGFMWGLFKGKSACDCPKH